jgi:hypothetical protein
MSRLNGVMTCVLPVVWNYKGKSESDAKNLIVWCILLQTQNLAPGNAWNQLASYLRSVIILRL